MTIFEEVNRRLDRLDNIAGRFFIVAIPLVIAMIVILLVTAHTNTSQSPSPYFSDALALEKLELTAFHEDFVVVDRLTDEDSVTFTIEIEGKRFLAKCWEAYNRGNELASLDCGWKKITREP